MSRTRVAATAVILVGVVGLAACGTNGQDGTGSFPGQGSCDTSKGTLVVGLIAPLLGDLSALGLGMRNAADLAIDQANSTCTVPGYALRLQAEDDQSLPDVAAEAANLLAADPTVAGVVGTLNSSTAQTVAPILAAQGIAMVSPANTSPALTRGEDYAAAPVREFENYFRVSTTDDLQGPFGAQYLVETAGVTRIAVVDDGKTYGAGLADTFVAAAEALGATVVAREQVDDQDDDFSEVIDALDGVDLEAVYYGGEYPVAGLLSGQLGDAGLAVPVMGGDALINAEYVPLGGREGDLGTGFGAPVDELPSARGFVQDYAEANYAEDFETYGAFTYDATNIVIRSLAAALGDGEWSVGTRPGVVAAVQRTDVLGASGRISFDRYGDTSNRTLTVYRVVGGEFVPVRTGEYVAG